MTDRPPNERPGTRFRLGDIWVTPSANEVGEVRVEAKAIDVLQALVDAAPTPMSAQALLRRVWPDVVVVDNVVYQAIAQLRKALADDAHAPRFIENVPRRGYRLIAEVSREPTTAMSSRGSRLRVRHNLPTQLTSFVGRERELAEVGELLAAHRLVTVVGVGGCGKTRLALAVADACLEDFPMGVWLVELARITDPSQVASEVAKVLDVGETGDLSLRGGLLAVLEDEPCLLVLDNCEHLIDPCAELVEAMLRRRPGLRILATSREPLRVAGEHLWRIQPLAVPDPAKELTVEEMARIDSAQLFVERASMAAPGYALTAQNASALAHICRRLDGIPLALELAAARVQTLSVEDIAVRLAASFGLLTGGSRTALPRQRTLRATLDWSHDLLRAPERVLLRRLSVFANGFTLPAAEGVGGSDPLAPKDILEQLTRLIEQSMVQVVNTSTGIVRYRLLEPMRQYGHEKLIECGEVMSTRNRHRDYFVGLGAEFTDDFRVGNRSAGIYPRFIAEYDNFELALTWCLETDAAKGLALATSVCRFFLNFEPSVSMDWVEIFLSRTPETIPERAEALCLSVARNPDRSRQLSRFEDALVLARRSGERWHEVFALVLLANTRAITGAPAEAARLVECALGLARASNDANMLGWCLYFINLRKIPGFRGSERECVTAFASAGNDFGRVLALRKWVGELLAYADADIPREHVDELIALSRAQGFFQGIMVGCGFLGHLAERQGDLPRALRYMEEANDVAPAYGLWSTPHTLARVLARMGQFERAVALLRDYLRRSLAHPFYTAWVFAQCLLDLAFIAGGRAQYDLAARLFGASMRFRRDTPRGAGTVLANDMMLLEEVTRMIRRTLGEAAWTTLCAEGAALTLQQVTALAMTDQPLESATMIDPSVSDARHAC